MPLPKTKTKKLVSLLQKTPEQRGDHPNWLSETLDLLLNFPLELPQPVVTHDSLGLPYVHLRAGTEGPHMIQVKKAVEDNFLATGCGIAIHLKDEGNPRLYLRYGDLVQIQLTGKIRLNPTWPGIPWGTPSKKFSHQEKETTTGKIAFGATEFQEIPEEILPKVVQETIRNCLNRAFPGKYPRVGLLHCPIPNTKSLVVLTQGLELDTNATKELLHQLKWHCPHGYYWTALDHHEES